jgi:hypothetical protein
VRRDVCSRQCLTCRSGSRTSSVIIFDFAGSRMSRKRNPAYIGHLEHARIYPLPARFNSQPGAVIAWVFILKIWQGALGAITGPDCQRLVAGIAHKVRYQVIFVGNC